MRAYATERLATARLTLHKRARTSQIQAPGLSRNAGAVVRALGVASSESSLRLVLFARVRRRELRAVRISNDRVKVVDDKVQGGHGAKARREAA